MDFVSQMTSFIVITTQFPLSLPGSETFQPNMTLKHATYKLFLKLHFKQQKSECSYTINHWDAKLPELWGTCSVLSNHE